MGVRETVNRRPASLVSGIIVTALLAGTWGWKSFDRRPRTVAGFGKAFFTTDDGQSWFVDSAENIPPFDYDGKTAYQVQVFRCAHGGEFAAFMQSYSSSTKAMLEKAIARGMSGADVRELEMNNPPMVKKPGASQWLSDNPQQEDQYRDAMRLVCPDGTGDGLEKVDPND
jgi:hypothetical protein